LSLAAWLGGGNVTVRPSYDVQVRDIAYAVEATMAQPRLESAIFWLLLMMLLMVPWFTL
jgi:hypothetical protein